MSGGRPTDYTPELADKICERLALGESMRSVARDEAMPAMSTLFKWLRLHQTFAEQYARAKEESADAMSEDVVEIADGKDSDGDVQRDRLRVDTRKWLMAKMKPKKYGDKVQQDITSGGKPVNSWVVNPVTTEKK